MIGGGITKAMVLAAGLGTRLRPLTATMPKPLLPIGRQLLIDYVLDALARAGIREVVVNTHYLAEQLQAHVQSYHPATLHVRCSHEPTILGTGGGLRHVAPFFGTSPFLVMNADILTDLELRRVITAHQRTTDAAATLVVRRRQPGERYTPLQIATDGHLQAFGAGDHHYTGILIGTHRLLQQLPARPVSCLIEDGLKPLLAAGAALHTYEHTGYWNDVGTPERYDAAKAWVTQDHSV